MPEKKDIERFKQILNECLDEKINIKNFDKQKKLNIIEKFKKAVGR